MSNYTYAGFLSCRIKLRGFLEYIYAGLWEYVLTNTSLKINRINPLLVIISSKLPAITNVIHKLLWVLQTIPNDNKKL